MVRAPCCSNMGLKKGPWTPEEDRLLISYVEKHGHENWRALPKQAANAFFWHDSISVSVGLLRCGKSCRLRWTNYLRPGIKRGNYTMEEEETIINLHETLGNRTNIAWQTKEVLDSRRWSEIASKLPGRTDNEIKNVWHTHLKKRIKPTQTVQDSPRKCQIDTPKFGSKAKAIDRKATRKPKLDCPSHGPPSPSQSLSETLTTPCTNSSNKMCETSNEDIKEEAIVTPYELSDIDDNIWSDAFFADYGTSWDDSLASFCSFSGNEDGIDFWMQVFMEAGDLS
ncbi:hypothetical protein ZIOFF_019306 [Zingiber officinale]|uniref:Uncharacterized protein n=1 Tax=Zingiber officinale TaxID=94328 RepID=A0A8J5H9D3_ZINOF|nr:hypothetical protein ZIOFF_019306 [Zingiber officinale]